MKNKYPLLTDGKLRTEILEQAETFRGHPMFGSCMSCAISAIREFLANSRGFTQYEHLAKKEGSSD